MSDEEKKLTDAQLRATAKYKSKALRNVSFLIMPDEKEIDDKLIALGEKYGSNAKALKAAILALAEKEGL